MHIWVILWCICCIWVQFKHATARGSQGCNAMRQRFRAAQGHEHVLALRSRPASSHCIAMWSQVGRIIPIPNYSDLFQNSLDFSAIYVSWFHMISWFIITVFPCVSSMRRQLRVEGLWHMLKDLMILSAVATSLLTLACKVGLPGVLKKAATAVRHRALPWLGW